LPKTTLRLSDSEGKVLSILFEKLEEKMKEKYWRTHIGN